MSIFGPKKDTIKKATSDGQSSLDRDAMFTDAWWLQYCCCRGVAIGAIGNPLFGSESRNFCVHEACECAPIGDPFFMHNQTTFCMTEQCQFPPLEGSPKCVCFNKPLGGGGMGTWSIPIFGAEEVLGFEKAGFWLYYCFCAGLALHKPRDGNRPCYWKVEKRLCLKQSQACVHPVGSDNDMISGIGTTLCFWEHCQFPPAKFSGDGATNSPFIACCGWKLKNKEAKGPNVKPFSYGKPAQEEMK